MDTNGGTRHLNIFDRNHMSVILHWSNKGCSQRHNEKREVPPSHSCEHWSIPKRGKELYNGGPRTNGRIGPLRYTVHVGQQEQSGFLSFVLLEQLNLQLQPQWRRLHFLRK